MSRGAARAAPLASALVLALPLGAAVALGSAWLLDRTRPWEPARWRPDRFVRVAARPDPGGTRERWVIAIQPDCPQCMAETPRVADSARHPGIRVAALVVDCRSAPSPRLLDVLRVDELWWDAHDVWRRRWGHRMYGELMRFDAAGRPLDGSGVGP